MSICNEEQFEISLIEQRHNTTPESNHYESFETRKNRRPKTKARKNTAKLSKEEIKYRRFIYSLEKEIKTSIDLSLRENRFDTRTHKHLPTNVSLPATRTAIKSKRTSFTITTHRSSDMDPVTTSAVSHPEPMPSLKQNETKRLAADVQTILSGKQMRHFYTQFICSS